MWNDLSKPGKRIPRRAPLFAHITHIVIDMLTIGDFRAKKFGQNCL